MKSLVRILAACGAAALLPSLVISVLYAISDPDVPGAEGWVTITEFFLGSLLISATYVLVAGFPVLVISYMLQIIRWWSGAVVGFFLAVIPLLYVWHDTASILPLKVDASTGWRYVAAALEIGSLGALGGLAAWSVLHWFDTRQAKSSRPAAKKNPP